jgi:hypothetical protein
MEGVVGSSPISPTKNMKANIELNYNVGTNICMVTAYDDKCSEHGDFASRINIAYCLKHKYDFRVYTDGFDKTRPPAWSKILFVKDALKDYEWVFWIDADAIVTNHRIEIESYIQLGGDIFVCNETPHLVFNTGIFLIRQCDWSFWLLDEIWNKKEWQSFASCEQTAFNQIVCEGHTGHRMVYYPMREFNAVPLPTRSEIKWQPGDFIAHCMTDICSSEKVRILSECLKRVDYNLS